MNELALNQLPKPILTELEERQRLIITATEDAKTTIGQQLKSAQDLLSKNGYGCYGEWLDFIGMNRQTANRYIQRYDAIVTNCDNQDFKSLPDSLIYEYAKPSARPELKQAIEDGDIKTHKEFKELERKLKDAEERTRQYEAGSKNLMEHRDKLINQLQNIKPEVIEKEVNPADYENLKRQVEFYKKSYSSIYKEREKTMDENRVLRDQAKDKTYYKGLDTSVMASYMRSFSADMKKYEAMVDDLQKLTPEDEEEIIKWIYRINDQLTGLEMLIKNKEMIIINPL